MGQLEAGTSSIHQNHDPEWFGGIQELINQYDVLHISAERKGVAYGCRRCDEKNKSYHSLQLLCQDPGRYTEGTDPNLDKNLDLLGQIPQIWLDKNLVFVVKYVISKLG